MMKKMTVTVLVLAGLAGAALATTTETALPEKPHHHHHLDKIAEDTRIPLNLAPAMKQHQLANMRMHLEAIQAITGLMAENRYAEASEIAHLKLGLTAEMQMMCESYDNKNFAAMGLAFHKSGNELGDALKTGDSKASLQALNKTMGYCVECHSAYRQ